MIINRLLGQTNRSSTTKSYLGIWRQFNKFVISLDVKPNNWEDRVTLFIGYKINQGIQSSTVKSYVSAIKKTLMTDGYPWDDEKVMLGALTSACKLVNDIVLTRLPIQCSLLEMILFELQRVFNQNGQQYLQLLYKTLFALSYYGLMRACEVTQTTSGHVLNAKDISAAKDKEKILIVLYSSKTHTEGMRPQKIKITSNKIEKSGKYIHRHFCPFVLMKKFMEWRGGYLDHKEQFFIFGDRSPVTASHARTVLKTCLSNLGLEPSNYGMHSFRVGRTSDLIKYNYSLEEVMRMGHWHSNTVYRYIR